MTDTCHLTCCHPTRTGKKLGGGIIGKAELVGVLSPCHCKSIEINSNDKTRSAHTIAECIDTNMAYKKLATVNTV